MQAAPELNHLAARGFVLSPLKRGHMQHWQSSEIHIKCIKTNSSGNTGCSSSTHSSRFLGLKPEQKQGK